MSHNVYLVVGGSSPLAPASLRSERSGERRLPGIVVESARQRRRAVMLSAPNYAWHASYEQFLLRLHYRQHINGRTVLHRIHRGSRRPVEAPQQRRCSQHLSLSPMEVQNVYRLSRSSTRIGLRTLSENTFRQGISRQTSLN